MKQKYTLTLLAALTLGAAQADVVRTHYRGNTGEIVDGLYVIGETYSDDGANNLKAIYRGQGDAEGNIYIDFGDADFYTIPGLDYMMTNQNFRRLEFLRPETVTVEIDMPRAFQMIWTSTAYKECKYCLEYTGRIKFVDGADTSKPSKGTLFVGENISDSNIASWLASDAAVDYDGETSYSGAITFSDCSSNITQKMWSEYGYNWNYTRLDYVIGGDNPNEATFTISIPSDNLNLYDTKCVLISDDNSFNDQHNIGGYTVTDISSYGGVSKTTYIRTDHLTQQLSYNVPSTIAALGGTVVVKLAGITIDGSEVGSSDYGKYIVGNVTEWTIPISNTTYSGWLVNTDSYSVDIDYDFSTLDLSQDHSVEVTFSTAGFETGATTNSWLDAMISVVNQRNPDFSHTINLLPEEPYLLSIDVNKMSFPDCEPSEGSLEALFDDDPSTFCHSAWSIHNDRSEPYGSYIDIELDEPIQSVGFAMQARDNSNPIPPTKMRLYCSNDGESWTLIGEPEVNWTGTVSASWNNTYADESSWFNADEPFKYLRWCAIENRRGEPLTEPGTSSDGNWNLAELHFYGK